MKPAQYVGSPDFHDGFIREVAQGKDKLFVTVEGSSGKYYLVTFESVTSIESHKPQNMMLYALSETEANGKSMRRYEFINWYVDESEHGESKSYLRLVAKRFKIEDQV